MLHYTIDFCIVILLSYIISVTSRNEIISRIYKNNRRNHDSISVVDETTYPRSNQTLKQQHKKKWLVYYECLKEKYAQAGPNKMMYPVALTALEDSLVKFECQVCLSPLEMHMTEEIKWYFNSSIDHKIFNKIADYTENVLISPDGKFLTIHNVQFSQTGLYWCVMGDTIQAPYYLYVDNDSESINTVHPKTAPNPPYPTPPLIISEYNLKAFTIWTKWSACSTCDIVGKKTRYGYCTLSMIENSIQEYISNKSKPLSSQETKIKEIIPQNIKIDLKSSFKIILSMFKNKLPCKSKYVPKLIQDNPNIKNRSTEVMVTYCKITCSKDIIFEIRDKQGNVLESANNSAGIYSMTQGLPIAPPSIVRDVLYKKRDKKLQLRCPGILTDVPIVWKIKSKILIPSDINKETNGRIYVDPRNHIVFKKLKFVDANIYSCWQNNELVGTIILYVEEEVELKVNQQVVTIGGIIIIFVFLKIFWKAFQGRTRFTKH